MPDWLKSMKQTFEFYRVNPKTWKDESKLDCILSCTITRDSTTETLESASLESTEEIQECYIRVYLITIQNGVRERFPLGTFLAQTPSVGFNGKRKTITIDAYSPLTELKENNPPIGHSVLEGSSIMGSAIRLLRENMRAPISDINDDSIFSGNFVSELDDTWLTYLSDMVANASYDLYLDELGRVLFAPMQDIAAMQPRWNYTDDNSSILYPEVTIERDYYGVPNVVEVIASNDKGSLYAKAVNDDPNSIFSVSNRGRIINYRVTDPQLSGNPTQEYLNRYAESILRNLSAVQLKVTYTHGFCPVRVGDGVLLNYRRASINLNNVKAKVVSQHIKCEPGCPVEEEAVFTLNIGKLKIYSGNERS